MDRRMTPAEAWEGFVGSQTPAEFMDYSRKNGVNDVDAACERYVKAIPSMFDTDVDVPGGLADLLATYTRRNVASYAIGEPWVTAKRLDWDGFWPVVRDGVVIDIIDASEGDAGARARGYIYDEENDYYVERLPLINVLVESLNVYSGDDMWNDVILTHPLFDADATAAEDPTYTNTVVVLVDGTIIDYSETDGTWGVRN